MTPSLNASYERLRRADVHIKELKTVVAQFVEAHPRSVERKASEESTLRTVTAEFQVVKEPLPDGIGSLVGEIVQSLRIPLDYLIYELAWLDSGTEQDDTQFPIFWTRKAFKAKKSAYLRGLNPAHRYAIELLQPYKGGKWLGTLASLAIPDKHKTLVQVAHGASLNGLRMVREVNGGEPAPEMKMELDFFTQILLPNKTPVVDGLEALQSAIRATVDQFAPCFRGDCVHSVPRTASDARRTTASRNTRTSGG